jgi:hypothetical protein
LCFWYPDIAVEPPDQEFADLACAPVRLLALGPHDQSLELPGGVDWRNGPVARSDRLGLRARVPCTDRRSCNRFCARRRNPGRRPSSAHHQQPGGKAKALFRDRTHLPRHRHLPPGKKAKSVTMCSVRNVTYVSGRSLPAKSPSKPVFSRSTDDGGAPWLNRNFGSHG